MKKKPLIPQQDQLLAEGELSLNGIEPAFGIVRNRNHRMRVVPEVHLIDDNLLTQQQFRDECDMNSIVARANRGIAPSRVNRGTPQYGDFSNVPDIAASYNIVKNAEAAFMKLPAQLRLELDNNPANVNQITKDQLQRYKLLKEDSTPSQPIPTPPKAGQADLPEKEKSSKSDAKTHSVKD